MTPARRKENDDDLNTKRDSENDDNQNNAIENPTTHTMSYRNK